MSEQRTLGPWKVYDGTRSDNVFSPGKCVTGLTSDGYEVIVARTWYLWPERSRANAAFIVEACNNYNALITALEGLRNAIDTQDSIGILPAAKLAAINAADAILAKVRMHD